MIALKRAGFHGSDRKLKRLVRQSLMEGDGIRKRTNGNHGKGTLYHYSEFRRTHGWKRQNGQLVKVKFRGPKISARRIAGAGAIGGAIFLASLPNNAAAGYYRELTLLTQQVRRQTEGPSLFQEVEALAIIKDFNDELMGNVFTTYAGWDAWRWGFDLD